MTDRISRVLAASANGERAGHGPGVDLLLVTSLSNVRYLSGFTGSNAAILIGSDSRVFLTDSRYRDQSATEVDSSFDRCVVTGELLDEIPKHVPKRALRLGFEDRSMTVHEHSKLRGTLDDRVDLVAAGTPIESLRAVKDEDELARIRAAAELADDAFAEIIAQGLAGRTEIEVALALEDAMRRRGASDVSFETTVAAGPHAALPHGKPRDVTIGDAELVIIDWGAVLDGYCSDCTRTVASGALSDDQRETYQLVLEAELAGLDALRPGVGGREADRGARAVIEAAGRGGQFDHAVGHGVGLEVHERPRISRRSEDVIEVGNVVTCEPGVYVSGAYGARIEDLCIVGSAGCEILTHQSKELVVAA